MSASKCIKPRATNRSEGTLRGIVLVMALAALLFPVAAWADTIPLESGTLTYPFGGFPALLPDSVLQAKGPDFALFALSGPLAHLVPGCVTSCPPGNVVTTRESIFGATQGGLTFEGVSYGVNDGATRLDEAFVSWVAAGAPIVLPALGSAFTVTEPFTIAVDVTLTTGNSLDGFDRRLLTATGGGEATFTFALTAAGNSWQLTSASYLITPEPSTRLLVPTAVGLAWLAHKKRKATKSMHCPPAA